ncbi:DNA polymerase III subunit gamma/tau [Acholeplasma manati]|uniref:DNA polymerase III subunit gamma/tau n=1 Tax=Paracholeplasma manati TaxID=591373 RepID=A0ABT2Y4K9_9MOLU|nr:DNA polymerase III subunit gamma/tau [Paracholeplasma manati]MCV2231422.1 DNA polymerase III subunit gamma/tau [Paracholeplasma manati]
MSYQALYRTYRPRTFKEVAGQEVIVKTLQNALLHDKIAHAYLFSGPRGTGKTSIAKILAKAVNCEKAPIKDACGECATCKAIQSNTIGDVVEIDAASNNGVDEIRDLREKVKYLPSMGKFKVYIIDEVHMLSTGAFNALLKTLEEPPKHVIFILATTEPNKIPSTILSRCQRFDFRGISPSDIEKKLKEIRDIENIKITDEAIREVARYAEGGLRDALSLLDQAISFADENVTEEDIYAVSGSVSKQNLIQLLDFIYHKKTTEAFSLLNDMIEDGKEVNKIVSDLIATLRDLLIEKNVVFDAIRPTKYVEDLSKQYSNDRIYFYLEVLNGTQNDIKWSNQKRAYLELAIVKMIDHQNMDRIQYQEQLQGLQERIKGLEFDISKLKTAPREIRRVVEEKESIEPTSPEPTISDKKPLVTVQDVERLLQNANIDKKALLLKGWERLPQIKDAKLQAAAMLLHEGKLVAASDKEILLVYPDKINCQMMLKPNTKQLVFEILNSKTKLIDDYICIDEASWQVLFDSFAKQWRDGNKKPTLPKLDLGLYEAVEESWQPGSVSLAIDFFGKDKVMIKE